MMSIPPALPIAVSTLGAVSTAAVQAAVRDQALLGATAMGPMVRLRVNMDAWTAHELAVAQQMIPAERSSRGRTSLLRRHAAS